MISIVCKSGVSFFYATTPLRVVVCDLLNPRPMLPRALYFASFFLVLFGRSIADEVNPSISPTVDHPLKVKVVVVAMFEVGADTGDVPGEFQFWVERRKLAHVISLPSAYHDVRTDGSGLIGTVTGMGTAKASTSIIALGLDPRFDFSQAYWLVAGIAGIDPNRGTVGSAVWADYVVDGDLAHEIDSREIPKGWPDGFTPLGKAVPFEQPRRQSIGEVYTLNSGLVHWAYELTRSLRLADNEKTEQDRIRYHGYPKALAGPEVLIGATLSSSTYWHGKLLNQWAHDWVKYWTDGKGEYYTTAMEDTGTMQALTNLAKAGRVDLNRVLVLRTASNFDSPPPGVSAAQDLKVQETGHYSAWKLRSSLAIGLPLSCSITGTDTPFKFPAQIPSRHRVRSPTNYYDPL
jgi:purine nucleoside permease